jgi:hypothetical protein
VGDHELEREEKAYHFNVKVSLTHPLSQAELDENATWSMQVILAPQFNVLQHATTPGVLDVPGKNAHFSSADKQ